jgi:hypothetical protein
MPQPIVAFLHHSLMLKAAMAECVDAPEPKTVHRLRSTTRRMEAILELLATSADLPNGRQKESPSENAFEKFDGLPAQSAIRTSISKCSAHTKPSTMLLT